MLVAARRKFLYLVLTALTLLVLLGSPAASRPVFADCSNANPPACGG